MRSTRNEDTIYNYCAILSMINVYEKKKKISGLKYRYPLLDWNLTLIYQIPVCILGASFKFHILLFSSTHKCLNVGVLGGGDCMCNSICSLSQLFYFLNLHCQRLWKFRLQDLCYLELLLMILCWFWCVFPGLKEEKSCHSWCFVSVAY